LFSVATRDEFDFVTRIYPVLERLLTSLRGCTIAFTDVMSPAAQSDRDWLLIGVAESCAARGYELSTIADICAAAGVSRRSFETIFASKDDCLAAAMESVLDEAQRGIEAVDSPGKPWAATLRDGVAALLDLIAERPAFARMALVEAPAAGGRAAALHVSAKTALLSYVERGREQELEEPGIPASAARAALAGADALIVGQILAGKTEQLGKLTPDVVYLLTVPYLGRGEAQRLASMSVAHPHLRAVA
jgi:AcrR family transcriptional regulator